MIPIMSIDGIGVRIQELYKAGVAGVAGVQEGCYR
jgi:hypothetical protein